MTSNEPQPIQNKPGMAGRPLLDHYQRQRRLGALLIWGGLLLLFLVALIASARAQPPVDVQKLGVHLLLDDGRNRWDTALWAEHMAYAGRISGDGAFAVQVIRVDDLNARRWQRFVDLCVENRLTPMLRLATTFNRGRGYWRAPQTDADGRYRALAQQYAAFLGALDWRGLTPHVILLNEVNSGGEWGGRPDAAAYARFVADVAPALRAAVPNVRLLNAALDLYIPNTGSQPFPGGFYSVDADTFMHQLAAADPRFFTHFDLWNNHSYPLGAFRLPPAVREYRFDAMHDAAPVTALPPADIYNRGINGYEWELWKLSQFGIAHLRVAVTEVGYRYAANAPSADAGEGYPDVVTAAAYLDAALRGAGSGSYRALLADERVVGVALFALNGAPWEWAHTNLLRVGRSGRIEGTTTLYDVLVGYFGR